MKSLWKNLTNMILLSVISLGCLPEDEKQAEINSAPTLERCDTNAKQIDHTITDENLYRAGVSITDLAFDGNIQTTGYTHTLNQGDHYYMEFELTEPIDCIQIYETFSQTENVFSIGDVAIYEFDGSTWNIIGQWENNLSNIDNLDFQIDSQSTQIRIEFHNNGKGLHGGTPALYVSEIYFWRK